MRNLLILMLLPIAAYVALCLLLFLGQRSQIYFPVRESQAAGAAALRLPVDGAELKIWSVVRAGPRALIYFGGNAEDVAASIPGFAVAFPDHSLYLVNYRGYGGSGVAAHLAGARDVHRLALVTPFDSLVNVARDHYRWLPVGLLMRDRYDSASRARAIRAPTLMIIAGADEIIPRQRSEALAAAFADAQLRTRVIAGATHNRIDMYPQYLELLEEFLAR